MNLETLEEDEDKSVDHFIWEDVFSATSDKNLAYAKWILMHFRLPAVNKSIFDQFMKDHKLFCEYEGKTYAVIGASRMGDVWLTSNLEGKFPYEKRVNVYDCKNFRPTSSPEQ